MGNLAQESVSSMEVQLRSVMEQIEAVQARWAYLGQLAEKIQAIVPHARVVLAMQSVEKAQRLLEDARDLLQAELARRLPAPPSVVTKFR